MIIFKDKGYQIQSDKPNEDWTGNAKFIVADGADLANKIIALYPHYYFILDKKGKLIDVVATEIPTQSPETTTEEEKQATYDNLSIQYIHEKFSLDEENKIMREYLSDMTNATYKEAFEAYNAYVQECKLKAHKEIYKEN